MKRWFFPAFILLLAISLCACSAQQDSPASVMDMSSDAPDTPAAAEQPEGGMSEGAFPHGDSSKGDMPEGFSEGRSHSEKTSSDAVDETQENVGKSARTSAADTDVIGRVDSLIGNEAVLTLGAMEKNAFTPSAQGETATYLLPVGMSIGSGDFTSVTAGMVLGLSLNEEGAITAVSILSR